MKFTVRNQLLRKADDMVLVSHADGYPTMEFQFLTEDWKGLTKHAIFKREDAALSYDMTLTNDKCVVPKEVLADGAGYLNVSLYGGTLITTCAVKIEILYGGYVTDATIPTDPYTMLDIATDDEHATYILGGN